jgi:hypothetical protein
MLQGRQLRQSTKSHGKGVVVGIHEDCGDLRRRRSRAAKAGRLEQTRRSRGRNVALGARKKVETDPRDPLLDASAKVLRAGQPADLELRFSLVAYGAYP